MVSSCNVFVQCHMTHPEQSLLVALVSVEGPERAELLPLEVLGQDLVELGALDVHVEEDRVALHPELGRLAHSDAEEDAASNQLRSSA